MMKRLVLPIVATLGLGPATALAQNAGAAPAAPAGGAQGAGPGGAGTSSGNPGFVVTDEEDTPNIYGVDNDGSNENGPQPNGPSNGPPRDVPPTHVVRKGDTLWEICKSYLGNPWDWPKVWSYNPNITNPHWIFPGDTVHLVPASMDMPGGGGGSGGEPIASNGGGKAPRQRFVRRGGTFGGGGLALRELGFVEEGDLKAAAQIVGSREEKIMLSSGDQAYVEFSEQSPLRVGERYTIYRVERDISHPVTKQKLGYVVLIIGEVQVDQVTQGRIARATIADCNTSIERGYRVGPLARRWKNIESRKNGATIEGYVVAALRSEQIITSEELVFVDKGRRDGVADGNRFFVVRRGDGYIKRMSSTESTNDDPRYPKEVVAEVLVVEAHDRTSVGYVSRVNKEVRPGDRIEMRRGY